MDPKKVCRICGETAKGKQLYFAHYGGICCLGCKAFFRRIHQDGKDVSLLTCGGTNNCEIRPIKRAKCKKCRYKKCLENGLRPELVLNEEERKKYTFPKRSSKAIANATMATSELMPMDDERGLQLRQKNLLATELNMMMESIIAAYAEADYELEFNEEDKESVIRGHYFGTRWTPSRADSMFCIVHKLPSFLERFAARNPYFTSLSCDDQAMLLNNNDLMYANYIMARYLGAENGLDQLTWILGHRLRQLSIGEIQKLTTVTFDQLNIDGLLIPTDETRMIHGFKESCAMIQANFRYPQFYNGLVAFYLLFGTQHWTPEKRAMLDEPKRIEAIQEYARKLVNFGCKNIVHEIGSCMLEQLVNTLHIMATIIYHPNLSLMKHYHQFQEYLCHENETKWLESKLEIYEAASKGINLDGFLSLLIEFSNGKTEMRPQISLYSANIMLNNFQNMIDMLTPEIRNNDRLYLSRSNLHRAMSLLLVQALTCSTFEQQVSSMISQVHGSQFDLKNVEPLTMEKFNGVNPIFKKHEIFKHGQLKKAIGQFISEKDLMILVTYLIILDGSQNPVVTKLRNLFESMLLRKVMNVEVYKMSNPETVVHDFFANLQDYCTLIYRLKVEANNGADV